MVMRMMNNCILSNCYGYICGCYITTLNVCLRLLLRCGRLLQIDHENCCQGFSAKMIPISATLINMIAENSFYCM